jgi:hypothetical protein
LVATQTVFGHFVNSQKSSVEAVNQEFTDAEKKRQEAESKGSEMDGLSEEEMEELEAEIEGLEEEARQLEENAEASLKSLYEALLEKYESVVDSKSQLILAEECLRIWSSIGEGDGSGSQGSGYYSCSEEYDFTAGVRDTCPLGFVCDLGYCIDPIPMDFDADYSCQVEGQGIGEEDGSEQGNCPENYVCYSGSCDPAWMYGGAEPECSTGTYEEITADCQDGEICTDGYCHPAS